MNLRQHRVLKNLTQYHLLKSTGIPQSRISIIERGYVKPRPDEKQAIARALGCSPDDIDWDHNARLGKG